MNQQDPGERIIVLKRGESLRVEHEEHSLAVEIFASVIYLRGSAFAHDEEGEYNVVNFAISPKRPS